MVALSSLSGMIRVDYYFIVNNGEIGYNKGRKASFLKDYKR
jgi:hypothetical protein